MWRGALEHERAGVDDASVTPTGAACVPLGDLGVRNGIAKHFGIKDGKGKKNSLCEKKDGERMTSLFEPFKPYRSIATWLMYRALESEPYDEAMS